VIEAQDIRQPGRQRDRDEHPTEPPREAMIQCDEQPGLDVGYCGMGKTCQEPGLGLFDPFPCEFLVLWAVSMDEARSQAAYCLENQWAEGSL
jgi:hypothetical protein